MELVRDKRVKDAYMNSTIQNMFQRGELRKDHPLQRKPDQWNKSEKDGLVVTVIKDEDIDSIKVCEQLTPHGVILWVIDGLQRLTVLSSYRNGGFKIGSNVEFPIISYQVVKKDSAGNVMKDEYDSYVYETAEYDLRGKGYEELPIELKEKFDNYKIDVVKHLDCTDEEIGYHIRRYNKQKSMNAAQNAVTYMDNIAKEVKRIALNNRFLRCYDIYSEKEKNNGTIDRIVMESVMCIFHLEHWQKQSKKMGAFLNEHSSRKEFDQLNENLNRLGKIYSEQFQEIFTSKDSFIWFTLFDRFTNLQLEDCRFAEFLKTFREELCLRRVAGESFYEIDKNGSTKDKSVITKKLELLEALMHDFLQQDKSSTKGNSRSSAKGSSINSSQVSTKNSAKDRGKSGIEDSNEDSRRSSAEDSIKEYDKNRIHNSNKDNILNNTKEPDMLTYIRENINSEVTEEDIELFEDMCGDYFDEIEENAELRKAHNREAIIILLAYVCEEDRDDYFKDWIIDFHKRNNAYLRNQKVNYLHMKNDFDEFVRRHLSA